MALHLIPQDKKGLLALYEGTHTTPGAQGTTLSFRVALFRAAGAGYLAELQLEPAVETTPEAALFKLTDNLRRVLEGMERSSSLEPSDLPVQWQAPLLPAGSKAGAR